MTGLLIFSSISGITSIETALAPQNESVARQFQAAQAAIASNQESANAPGSLVSYIVSWLAPTDHRLASLNIHYLGEDVQPDDLASIQGLGGDVDGIWRGGGGAGFAQQFAGVQFRDFYRHRFEHDGRVYEIGTPWLDYARPVLKEVNHHIILAIVGTFLVLLLFPLFFRRHLFGPLDNLLQGVRRADAGQMDASLPVFYEDEIGSITRSFNQMMASLRRSNSLRDQYYEELGKANEEMERRVADRTRELAAFFDLAMMSGNELQLEEFLEQVLVRIMAVSKSHVLLLHLTSRDHTELRLAGHQGLEETESPQVQQICADGDFLLWLKAPNDPIIALDLQQADLVPHALKLEGYQVYFGTQVRARGVSRGLLGSYRQAEESLSLEEISLLVALAKQLGIMVENYRLHQLMQEMAAIGERRRLAQDLHDSITQLLYSQTLFAQSGQDAFEDGDTNKLADNLGMLGETAQQALREMRLLLYQLQPEALEADDLALAIDKRLTLVERRLGIEATSVIPANLSLSDHGKEILYRVIMEALNNSLKHAEATHIDIEIALHGQELVLSIADDGCGFDTSSYQAGMGIQNMCDRVAQLSGQLSITSAIGRGTTIVVTLDRTRL